MLTLSLPSLRMSKSPNVHTPVISNSILNPHSHHTTTGSIYELQRSYYGLRTSSLQTAMAAYKIKLVAPNGSEREFEAPEDSYILDSADSAGIDLPCSCRAGACGSCAGKIISGSVNQTDAAFLDDTQLENGYVLLCAAYPTSDCVIHTHKDGEIY